MRRIKKRATFWFRKSRLKRKILLEIEVFEILDLNEERNQMEVRYFKVDKM